MAIKDDIIRFNSNRMPPGLTLAVAKVESDYYPMANRLEGHLKDKYISEGFTMAEAVGMATSWGLFQIMGFNLKKLGITNWVTYLQSVPQQVDSFVSFGKPILNKYSGNIRKFAAEYNGGSKAVDFFNKNGYYGNAEPYVQKIVKELNIYDKSDEMRLAAYNGQEQPDFAFVIIGLGLATAGVLYAVKSN